MEPLKRRRLRNAMERLTKHGWFYPESVSISVKNNEVLIPKPEPLAVKPRAIAQLSPELLAATTAFNHAVTEQLHELWNEYQTYDVVHYSGEAARVKFVFASGYNARRLDLLFRHIVEDPDGNYCVVAGDDNITIFGENPAGVRAWLEGDFTQYDSTQGEDVMTGDAPDLLAMGADPDDVQWECDAVHLPFRIVLVVKGKRLVITFVTRAQQLSGRGSTTWGNSSHNIKNGVYWFQNLGRATLPELSAELGFILKLRYASELTRLTFLKGWWCAYDDGSYHWMPLPSMVLKLGKLLRHPSELFPGEAVEVAYRKALFALSRSPGPIPREYPILGPFIAMMQRVGIVNDLDLPHKQHRIQVAYHTAMIDVDAMLSKICERYSLDLEEIESFSRMCAKVDRVPVLLDSPVFGKLTYDYA